MAQDSPLIAAALALCALGLATNAQKLDDNHWCGRAIRTGPDEIVLEGQLNQKLIWGPPNFGENPKTDRRYAIWLLSLRYSVPVLINTEFSKGPGAKPETKRVWVRQIELEPIKAGQVAELASAFWALNHRYGQLVDRCRPSRCDAGCYAHFRRRATAYPAAHVRRAVSKAPNLEGCRYKKKL